MVDYDLILYFGEVFYFSVEEGKELFIDWGFLLKGRVNKYFVFGLYEEIVDFFVVEKIVKYLLNEFEGIKEIFFLLIEK